jgi:PAS domain S-box-containing protein
MSVLAIGCGQVALAAGLLHTYLTPGTAQAVGALGALCAALAIRALGLAAAARDAAEHASALSEQAVRRSEERFRTVLQDSQDVIVITDDTGSAFFVSSAVEHVMGWTVQEYQDRRDTIVHPDDQAVAQKMADAFGAGSPGEVVEMRLRHGDGSWRWHEVSARNLIDNPAVEGIVFSHRDITVRKQSQQQLAYEATHDPLTGLSNRTSLRDILAGWGAGGGLGAILYLDLDGFKQVNDELGHAVGDELLVHAARVMRDCQLDRHDAHAALRRADAAMYEAKRAGTHSWSLFRETLDDQRREPVAL